MRLSNAARLGRLASLTSVAVGVFCACNSSSGTGARRVVEKHDELVKERDDLESRIIRPARRP